MDSEVEQVALIDLFCCSLQICRYFVHLITVTILGLEGYIYKVVQI